MCLKARRPYGSTTRTPRRLSKQLSGIVLLNRHSQRTLNPELAKAESAEQDKAEKFFSKVIQELVRALGAWPSHRSRLRCLRNSKSTLSALTGSPAELEGLENSRM